MLFVTNVFWFVQQEMYTDAIWRKGNKMGFLLLACQKQFFIKSSVKLAIWKMKRKKIIKVTGNFRWLRENSFETERIEKETDMNFSEKNFFFF